MRKFGSLLFGAALAVLNQAVWAQKDSPAVGHWQGKVHIPNRELEIGVDLARNSKGVWIGSMSVVGASAQDVPLSTIAVKDLSVRFAADLPERASFDGRLSADAGKLSGTASNAAGEAPFELTRSGQANVKVPPASTALPKEFEGAWDGAIDAGGRVVRVTLKLSPAADGSAAATLIAVDQGNMTIPVTTVTIQGKQLELEARAISGSYRGTLGTGGEIAGEWRQGPARLPLTFQRAAPEKK